MSEHMSEHMSEPEDELTPLPEAPAGSALSRSPYIALGVAAVVVSTVFATVAALASTREESAAPAPRSQDAVESTTSETYTTDPTTTSSQTSSSAPSSTSSSTTTTTTEEETTTEDDDTTTPKPPPETTTPKPPDTTTPKPPANRPPTANIGGGCPETGFDCSFNGGGSTDPDGSINSYQWDFGDGATGSGENVSHTFAAGEYTVTLTVTDNRGGKDTTSMPVTVTAPPATSGN